MNVQAWLSPDGSFPEDVVLTWEIPTGSGPVDYFDILRDGGRIESLDPVRTSYSTGYDGDAHSWVIRAVGPGGSADSAAAQSGTQAPPDAPEQLNVQLSPNEFEPEQVVLTWEPVTTGGPADVIEISRDGAVIVTVPGNQTGWPDDDLFYDGNSHQYSLRAIGPGGSSPVVTIDSPIATPAPDDSTDAAPETTGPP